MPAGALAAAVILLGCGNPRIRTHGEGASTAVACAPLSSAPSGPVFTTWEWANIAGPPSRYLAREAEEPSDDLAIPLHEYSGTLLVRAHARITPPFGSCPPCPPLAACKTCPDETPPQVTVRQEHRGPGEGSGREFTVLGAYDLHARLGDEYDGILEVSGGVVTGCYAVPRELPPERRVHAALPDATSRSYREDLTAVTRKAWKQKLASKPRVPTTSDFLQWLGETTVLYPSRALVEAQPENEVPRMKRCAAVDVAKTPDANDANVTSEVWGSHRLRWPTRKDDGSVVHTNVGVSLSPIFALRLSQSRSIDKGDTVEVRASSGDIWEVGAVMAPSRWESGFVEFGTTVGRPVFGCAEETTWKASCDVPYVRECPNCARPTLSFRKEVNAVVGGHKFLVAKPQTQVHHSMCFGDCPKDSRVDLAAEFRERYGAQRRVLEPVDDALKVRFYKRRDECLADRG